MADKCFNSNPDIAGIGIRINFYSTILVAMLTPEKEYTEELLSGIYKNSVINGLGLLFTAVIQTVQGRLDLYHAIVLIYILIFLIFVIMFGERLFAWPSQTNFQMLIYLLMHAFCFILFSIWLWYVAIDGSRFGSQPSCNYLVKIAFFSTNIKTTEKWFKVTRVVAFALVIPFFSWLLGLLIIAPTRSTQASNALQKVFYRYPRLRLVRYVIGIPLATGIIVNLELTVHRNRPIIQPGENEWGFGQIIAVIMTLGIVIDTVTAIRERYRMKHHSRKNSED